MSFPKDFDELLDSILTDYKNQLPGADTSKGSLIFIKSACLASALWGIYKYQDDYISEQIFPDTASSANLDRHGWQIGVNRTYNESDDAYLTRILSHLRQRPSGGTKSDYQQWALSIDNVSSAYCYPNAQGNGTVDLIILANIVNTGDEIPSTYADITGNCDAVEDSMLKDTGKDFTSVKKGDVVTNTMTALSTKAAAAGISGAVSLVDDIFTSVGDSYKVTSHTQTVKDYIDTLRPVTVSSFRVLAPSKTLQNIVMSVTGDVNVLQIESDIYEYMMSLDPDETLYISQLYTIATNAGAGGVSVTTPAADVAPGTYAIIRPGTITIS